MKAEEMGISSEHCKLTGIVDHDIQEAFSLRHSSTIPAFITIAFRSHGATPVVVHYRMKSAGAWSRLSICLGYAMENPT